MARLGAGSPALIPPIVGTVLSAGLLVEVLTGSYPGAGLGGVLAIGAVAALSGIWGRELGAEDAG